LLPLFNTQQKYNFQLSPSPHATKQQAPGVSRARQRCREVETTCRKCEKTTTKNNWKRFEKIATNTKTTTLKHVELSARTGWRAFPLLRARMHVFAARRKQQTQF
jgi:hypothetical protein